MSKRLKIHNFETTTKVVAMHPELRIDSLYFTSKLGPIVLKLAYEDGSEFEDEFDWDDIDLDENDFDEEYMMELRAEVPSSDDDDGVEDEVNDNEVGDDDDEGDEVEELNRFENIYSVYNFCDEEYTMELRAEVPSSDDDGVEDEVNDNEVGDDDDEGDEVEELNRYVN
nr:prostatic spermine-binding protein-like [Parasteatoda tepidariorum]